jgi:hypothetical protein
MGGSREKRARSGSTTRSPIHRESCCNAPVRLAGSRRQRLIASAWLLVACVSCVPRQRLNETCTWTGDAPAALDLRRRSDGRHLQTDVEVAEELGVRYGDSFRRQQGIVVERERWVACTDATFAEIARIHGVSRVDIEQARGHRNITYDLAIVILPMALLDLALADFTARRIYRRFPGAEEVPRLVATMVAVVVLTIAWYQIGSMWSFVAESYRLRDAHVSYRAYYVPWSHHAIVVLTCGAAAFAVVAGARYRRLDRDRAK